jgi:threonine/homoserine/homoserine lactone efflux protein
MQAIDSFTSVKAAGIAFFLSGLNPKNLLLVIAGAAAIAQTGIPAGEQTLALIVFILIASLSVMVPVGLYFALGDRSQQFLESLKEWLIDNNATIMCVLFLIIGAKLIGDAIAGFL